MVIGAGIVILAIFSYNGEWAGTLRVLERGYTRTGVCAHARVCGPTHGRVHTHRARTHASTHSHTHTHGQLRPLYHSDAGAAAAPPPPPVKDVEAAQAKEPLIRSGGSPKS